MHDNRWEAEKEEEKGEKEEQEKEKTKEEDKPKPPIEKVRVFFLLVYFCVMWLEKNKLINVYFFL